MTTVFEILTFTLVGTALIIFVGPWFIKVVSMYYNWCHKIQKKWDDK